MRRMTNPADQQALFDVGHAGKAHPDAYPQVPGYERSATSEAAAESIRAHVSRIARDVLRYLPDTCDGVEARSGMSHQTCSARFSELRLKGLTQIAADKNGPLKDRTRSGRLAYRHEITPEGRAFLAGADA